MADFKKPIMESHIFTTITKIITEDGNIENIQQEPEPQQPQTQEEVIQKEMDNYGNPLGYENPLTKGINDFAIKKSQLYDDLSENIKKRILIKTN